MGRDGPGAPYNDEKRDHHESGLVAIETTDDRLAKDGTGVLITKFREMAKAARRDPADGCSVDPPFTCGGFRYWAHVFRFARSSHTLDCTLRNPGKQDFQHGEEGRHTEVTEQ